MKTTRFTLSLALVALALLTLNAVAGDTQEKTRFKFISPEIGKLDLNLDPMEVGESRSFTTDSGKPIEITRTEEGFTLDVDGKEIKIKMAGGEGNAFHFETGAHGGEGHQVIVMKKGGAADGTDQHVMIVAGDEDSGDGNIAGKKVIHKRIVTKLDGKDGEEVQVKVLDDDAEVIDLESLEGLDLSELVGDGEPHVIVIRKSGDAEGGPHKIEVRVQKKAESEDGEQN